MRAWALFCGNAEPSLGDLLSDPIGHLLMERDGVRPQEVYDLMADIARRHGWARGGRSPSPRISALAAEES